MKAPAAVPPVSLRADWTSRCHQSAARGRKPFRPAAGAPCSAPQRRAGERPGPQALACGMEACTGPEIAVDPHQLPGYARSTGGEPPIEGRAANQAEDELPTISAPRACNEHLCHSPAGKLLGVAGEAGAAYYPEPRADDGGFPRASPQNIAAQPTVATLAITAKPPPPSPAAPLPSAGRSEMWGPEVPIAGLFHIL